MYVRARRAFDGGVSDIVAAHCNVWAVSIAVGGLEQADLLAEFINRG